MLPGPRLGAMLDVQFGDRLGGVAHHMLVGYTPDEVAKPDLYTRLVDLLSPDQEDGGIGMRELGPRHPETAYRPGRPGLRSRPPRRQGVLMPRNDLLRKNELRPQSASKNSSELRPPPAPRTPKAKTPR